MIVYRIVHKTLTDLLSGSGRESRWCSAGRKVIYTSGSVSLCCLETLLRLGGSGFSSGFLTVSYEIPEKASLEEVPPGSLSADWRLRSNYPYCQETGNRWYDKKESLVLKVPSAVIPDEYNYVIKTTSPGISRVRVINQKIFSPDQRLEKILRGR